ncbi:ABC transporter ATP-binding protein [Haladaptatus halobius]|uniref:ABC transporter ATP-binding protein n=1 Tax=Haladaptatus halobius TaxID=2884875 RepID=UPI001D0B4976|nr:ABC transporter ATP-binding protein [Haladaptatus halobius]
MSLLEVNSIDAGYNTGQALFDVNFSVEKGEVVSLLGRNGAGKTTTLRSVMGAAPPTVWEGDIRFDGESILPLEPYNRVTHGISFVPEERRLWPNLTVEENIQVAINHSPNPKGLEEVLSYFGVLQEMRERRARNMSGGEQQMLAIARGLAANPKLMLLDEPSEGLAPFIVRDVEAVISEINDAEDVTVLLVEQNAVMAMEVSDRHYLMDQGKIVTSTTPSELREDDTMRKKYLSV